MIIIDHSFDIRTRQIRLVRPDRIRSMSYRSYFTIRTVVVIIMPKSQHCQDLSRRQVFLEQGKQERLHFCARGFTVSDCDRAIFTKQHRTTNKAWPRCGDFSKGDTRPRFIPLGCTETVRRMNMLQILPHVRRVLSPTIRYLSPVMSSSSLLATSVEWYSELRREF